MKKIILFLLLTVAMATASQSQVITMTDSDTAIINTGAPTSTLAVTEPRAVITIQAVITKNSGTVAGKAELQASLDGTTYKRVASDTLVLLNQTTNTYFWVVQPSQYVYYRVKYTGVGTMNARISAYLLKRKSPPIEAR